MLLFVDCAETQNAASVGNRTNFTYLELFVGMGLEVRFLAADFHREEVYSTRLKQLGIETQDGEWFRKNWESWLRDYGPGIDYVFFNNSDAAVTFSQAVGSYTRAAIICQLEHPELKLEQSVLFEEKEDFISTHCDVLLALNMDEEKRFRAKHPHKKVFTVPHFETDKLADQNAGNWMSGILSASEDEAVFRIAKTSFDPGKQKPSRLIAFYLPQYHPIPENDEWWGEGFTEWRNVSKAKPAFSGHYQPHVPADLGYYDLRQEETRIAQAELAKKYGIEGFCYYHYWFNGKRLLERPMQDLIESGKPDFPFCVCWANESWTRRWDGKEQDILMKQEYCEEDDLLHIQSLLPLFKDKRYIRINGKPLFLVYRTESFPDPARTAEIWREEARKAGIGELYLCQVESFEKNDPEEIGFDAGLEFAPDWWNKGPQLDAGSELFSQPESDLKAVCDTTYVHSYAGLADAMMAKEIPEYKWLRCVTPAWDNWARRNEGGSIFVDSTPKKYREWLASAIDYTNGHFFGEERVVFINAWNEWAEGNHLEPDQKFGHAYLEATKEALEASQTAANVLRMDASEDRRVNRLMGQLARQKQQLNSYRSRLNELEEKKQELLESTSWRATLPLRWTKQLITDLKKSFTK